MKVLLVSTALVFFGLPLYAEDPSVDTVEPVVEVSAKSEETAETPPKKAPDIEDGELRWVEHKPFVPEKFDYYFELGAMWEERNMYWMGAGFGRHLGRCILTESQTCQQYWDLFGGVGGRDGLTSLLFLTGPRWQFVNFPKPHSPALKLFAGVMNIRDDARDKEVFAYGIGYGWTMAIHDRVNMRLEGRIGNADEVWYQTTVAVHIKMDRWVDYFGSQLKKFGIDAVNTTGGVFRKTGDAISGAFGRGSKDKNNQNQKKE